MLKKGKIALMGLLAGIATLAYSGVAKANAFVGDVVTYDSVAETVTVDTTTLTGNLIDIGVDLIIGMLVVGVIIGVLWFVWDVVRRSMRKAKT